MTYMVKSGDTLSGIASRLLGAASRWPEIYNLNRAVIGSDPNRIFPGQVLTIPGTTSGGSGGSGPVTGPQILTSSSNQSNMWPLVAIAALAFFALRK